MVEVGAGGLGWLGWVGLVGRGWLGLGLIFVQEIVFCYGASRLRDNEVHRSVAESRFTWH